MHARQLSPPQPARRRTVRAWLLLAACALSAPAAAQSTQPQPRVTYAMHSARINQIRATPDFQRLVTVSQDKTVRVWRMQDLELLRTIHVPSEAGEEGALRSLAVTPDGREVIVGGWTGIAWSGKGQLYRFDLATGQLLQTMRGLPNIVESLAISADGKRLAVGLGGRAGLRVLALPSGAELAADNEYGERITFADFARDGSLATTSQDGCVRMYDAQGRMNFRADYPVRRGAATACTGAELGGIRFSPDGRRLAFGMQDRVEMVVMDVATRALQVLKVEDPLQRSLCCLNWSGDGAALYMNGAHEGSGATPLYKVALANGAITRMDVGRQRFTNILPLPDGRLVFSTSAPSLGLIDAAGRKLAEALPPNGDFRFAAERFQLSADGSRVTLPMQADGSDSRTLDIGARSELAYRRATAADLAGAGAPRRDGPLRVEADLGEFGYKKPVTIGGTPVPLKRFQSVRSWALAPGRELVALGTQWSVLVVDKRGKPVWERDLPAPAYQVNVSADGRWVVVAVGDGSLRWYAIEQGTEALGAFLHTNGEDWVVWRADGFYKSSPGGDAYFGWLTNAGDSEAPRFVRAVQVERKLYRPDLVAPTLAQRGAVAPAALASTLAQLTPPQVTIEAIRPGARPGFMDIHYSVRAAGQPIRELGVYVDGIPVLRAAERRVGGDETAVLTRVQSIPVSGPVAAVRVEAETANAIGLDETAPLVQPAAAPRGRGKLWVVAAGVGQFDGIAACKAARSCRVDLPELPNTANDVRALAAELALQQGRAFASVDISVLTGSGADAPTKQNLVARLRALEAAQPEDTVVVFLASHGFAAPGSAEYFFVPKDATEQDILAVADPSVRPRAGQAAPESLLSGSELSNLLRRVPGRRIVLLDTCHSGAADGRNDPYALYKRSASAQVAVLSASRGDELSWEAFDAEHGAFTLALLGALQGQAGPSTTVTLHDVYAYSRPRVIDNARRMSQRTGRDIPQTPTLSAPASLQETVLALRRQ